jgi:hypothetical protein
MQMNGACLCGSVHYTCDADPIITLLCHCKSCQRTGGAPYSIDVGVPRAAFKVSGELTSFSDKGDESGMPVSRKFCAKCGSPIVSDLGATPDLLWIKAGSLDDTSWLKPQMSIWTESAQHWVKIDGDLPQYPRNPPLDG